MTQAWPPSGSFSFWVGAGVGRAWPSWFKGCSVTLYSEPKNVGCTVEERGGAKSVTGTRHRAPCSCACRQSPHTAQ